MKQTSPINTIAIKIIPIQVWKVSNYSNLIQIEVQCSDTLPLESVVNEVELPKE